MSAGVRRAISREVSKSLTVKRLQTSLTETVKTSTISSALYKSVPFGRIAKRKPLLRKVMSKNLTAFGGKKILWSDMTKVMPVDLKPKYIVKNPNLSFLQNDSSI